MFGEYMPLSNWLPLLEQLNPNERNLTAGAAATAIEFHGLKLAPSICFETTVPHLIRRHVNELSKSGNEPDVLVNITNDGWFFGTSCLDLHLACNVFRAVEMRKTHLVCANTGLSAEIESGGRILQQGPRREKAILQVKLVSTSPRFSLYRAIGDALPISFALACAGAIVQSFMERFTRRSRRDLET
jgi:apolipoprotein N-acyltransferase